ncbi:MAG: cytochrome b/b6 domain-containing protein [Inhella sp.]|uniref:cytochrome b n=1 Tax=Inhella sp. TaxID=1921806 RepID=UPI0022BE88B1|nr:cytochrome b/b6 domain-containing protein [Inhella sp.]MCZ8235844.1 cytochrome b/b6 domain-containing protein [Inhella sp.]
MGFCRADSWRHPPALVVLHWLLGGGLIVLGLLMGCVSLERLPNSDPAKLDSLRGHMINGAIIGCLMVVRLIFRVCTQRPPAVATGMAWTDAVGPWSHRALYGLVFATVASGIALAVNADLPSNVFGGSGKPLPATFDGRWMRVLHAIAATLLMALIVLHVAAVFWHHAVRRNGLLRRMGWSRER